MALETIDRLLLQSMVEAWIFDDVPHRSQRRAAAQKDRVKGTKGALNEQRSIPDTVSV